MQHEGRRWPRVTPTLTVASFEAIGLLWLITTITFLLTEKADGGAQATLEQLWVELSATDVIRRRTKHWPTIEAVPMSWTTFDLVELCLESQQMLASVEMEVEKCPEFKDASPFIPKGDIIKNYLYIGTLHIRWQETNWGCWLDNIPTQPLKATPPLVRNQMRRDCVPECYASNIHFESAYLGPTPD